MSKRDDGGTAFPFSFENVEGGRYAKSITSGGMSLRDYFAAKALQSLVESGFDDKADFPDVAERAYVYADAMLKARKA